MKILIVSLLKRRVAPEVTASRPRVIFDIATGLLKRGHEVTILGTGDSNVPGAKMMPVIPRAFTDLPPSENPFYTETAYLVRLAKQLEEIGDQFDIIHNHTYPEFINLMVADRIKTPMVTTIHAQATDELDTALSLFPASHLISISNAHKKMFKKARISYVVTNGVDTDQYAYHSQKDDYLLWLGRLSAAKNKDGSYMDPKGIKWAIQLAQTTNSQLLLSGNVESMDFFNQDVLPHLNDKIRWIGPVSKEHSLTKQQVIELMQRAKVFLMTINWYEPFGLVMAEAMSCGTPVIGFDRGSVTDLVIDAKTGFVVAPESGLTGLQSALSKIETVSPMDCREHAIHNFSLESTVSNYEKVYQSVLDSVRT